MPPIRLYNTNQINSFNPNLHGLHLIIYDCNVAVKHGSREDFWISLLYSFTPIKFYLNVFNITVFYFLQNAALINLYWREITQTSRWHPMETMDL